jgi:hypothetical protein
MKRVSICSGFVLLVGMCSFTVVNAQVVNISHAGSGPYSSLQAAIDDGATVNGDTITDAAGRYDHVTVTVDKALTLLAQGADTVDEFLFTVNPVKAVGFTVFQTTASGSGKIQDAIDAVTPTGNVGVESGTYHEHIVINKSMNLIGSTTTNPTIDGDGTGSCITLASQYIRIKQVVLTDAQYGISGTTTNSQIRYINVHDNAVSGISLTSSDFNLLHSITISGHTSLNGCGIELIGCKGNTLTANTISGNTYNIRISAPIYRTSERNIIAGNTLLDPGTWSVQISSGAVTSKVNFNVLNTTGTADKFISNIDGSGTLEAQHNWYQGQDPPGNPTHPTDFFGSVDSSSWFDIASNTYIGVFPNNYTLVTDDPVYVPVMAMVAPGKQVRVTQVGLKWNNHLAALEEGEIPGAFFKNKTVAGQTETFAFNPASPESTVTVYDTLSGGSGGAGPSGSIPYVSTLYLMKFRGIADGADTVALTTVVVLDQNFATLSPIQNESHGLINVTSTGTPGLLVNLKIALQGAFNGAGMDTTLRHNGSLPTTQPYTGAPFSYGGTETRLVPPDGAVDWVLVELRTGTAANTKFATRAGWVLTDGAVRELAGASPLGFTGLAAGNYYVVVRHRNHLAIMSAAPVAISSTGDLYDFTTGQAQAFGTNPMIALSGGVFGMYAGNSNGDNVITVADYNPVGLQLFQSGYRNGDHNLNNVVTVQDYNFVGQNLFKTSQVP